jgi:hypothetical protein
MEPQNLAQGPNVISGVDRLWGELAAAEPAVLCARSLTARRTEGFAVPFLQREYVVDPRQRTFAGPEGDPLCRDPEFQLLILGYLTGAGGPGSGDPAGPEVPAAGWVSERQLPGGSLFFQGPHALPLGPLLRRFATDLEGFREACLSLGGKPLEFGDASFAFRVLPLVPAGVLLWTADDEFPARAGMLFQPSVSRHLPLDLVLALAHAAVVRLTGAPGDRLGPRADPAGS